MIVAGVVGAEMSTRVILILGAANIADGFSMAASNYSGTKAELDDYRRHRAYEEQQVERIPKRNAWKSARYIETRGSKVPSWSSGGGHNRRQETLGRHHDGRRIRCLPRSGIRSGRALHLRRLYPVRSGAADTVFPAHPKPVETAIALTAVVFFVIGSIKAQRSTQPWLRSGTETLAIGLAAAGIAWLIGHLLKEAFL